MKAGKTPYEIRSDLLHLAYELLIKQKEAECAMEYMDGDTDGDFLVTKAPTTEEIVSEATKLNNFVSQSTGK